MKIYKTKEFLKRLKSLPGSIQKLCERQEKIFSVDWKDPRLHTQKLKNGDPIFSFRITRKYRVLFVLTESNSVLFVSIGHRKDIYD